MCYFDLLYFTVIGKAWGKEENPMVLCFHGILDNAGSFDRLISLLPDSYYYVAFDLPGHGFSSHFPPHLPIFTAAYIPVYSLIMEYFKRDKYIIIGHSYGGQIGFLFAQLYPEYVEKLIMLDTISLYPVRTPHFQSYLIDNFHNYLEMEKKFASQKQPTYTYEEAFSKLETGRRWAPLATKEAVLALMNRAVKLADDGSGRYVFTNDQRLKNFINPWRDLRYTIETLKHFPVLCPVLMVLAKGSNIQYIYFAPIVKVLKKWKNVKIVHVEGYHDVHNDFPERVAPHVIPFLEKNAKRKSKL